MQARWATDDDVDELVALRAAMFEALGVPDDGSWRRAAAEQLRTGIASGRVFAAVVDDPDGDGLAGAGVGLLWEALCGPGRSGRLGYVQSMATHERWRRRGVGAAVFRLLLDRFVEQGVDKVSLHASPDGEPLYRSFGFEEPSQPELRWSPG